MYRKKQNRILFISSSLYKSKDDNNVEVFDYFSKILTGISVKIDGHIENSDLVVKIPNGTDDSGYQNKILTRLVNIRSYRRQFCAIIISPMDRKIILDNLVELVKICTREGKPVFTIDKGYKDFAGNFLNEGVYPPFYSQADWRQGGGVAAASYMHFARIRSVKDHKLLILKGLESSEERIEGFINKIKEITGDQAMCPIIESDFSRKGAFNGLDIYFGKPNSFNIEEVSGIFCCNDEMALGVEDYFKNKSTYTHIYSPIIIGFDCITDVVNRIRSKDSLIKATVNVNLNNQLTDLITSLTAVLQKRKKYEDLVSRCELHKCSAYHKD